MTPHEDVLRRLSIRDDTCLDALLAGEPVSAPAAWLDGRTRALVRVAALVAIDAAPASYVSAVAGARRRGATSDELVGCLIAVLPAVGVARVVAAAPKLALALGLDVDDER